MNAVEAERETSRRIAALMDRIDEAVNEVRRLVVSDTEV